jgi:hypothetical protein
MSEFKIRVSTEKDGSGLQQAEGEVKSLKREVKSLGDAYRDAGGGIKGMAAAARQAKELYAEGGGGVKGVLSVLAGGGAKAAAAIAGLTTAVIGAKKALMEFAGAETAVRGLQTALAQNGHYSDEVNKKYQQLASTLQTLTGRADDEWIDVLKRLTQFGATPEDIERHVNAVKNLAGIMDGDLASAALAVSRAMQGEFNAFTRLGIQIDQHATQVEKLNQLYAELAQRGGGQLEAQAESLAGQFKSFKNSLSDFLEAIGQVIAKTGVVQTVLYGFGTTLSWLAEKIGGVIPAASGLNNALKKNIDTTIDAERFNRQYAESLKETDRWANGVADALQRQLDIQKAARQAADEATDAKMAFNLSIVDRQELLGPERGGISKEEAIRRRAVIRAGAGAERFQNQQQARNDEILTAQKLIENNQAAIEEAERIAVEAESKVVSEDDLMARKAALKAKHDAEVKHWEQNYQALLAHPAAYSNPELGVSARPRWGRELHDLGARITERVLAARAARDIALTEFDQQNPMSIVEGSQKRAAEARASAIKTRDEMLGRNKNLEVVIDALSAEGAAASKVYQIQSRTAAVTAGTELLSQNPNAQPNLIQDQVAQATGAFPGPLADLGSAINQNSSEFHQAMNMALKASQESIQVFRGSKEEWMQIRRELNELRQQFKKAR